MHDLEQRIAQVSGDELFDSIFKSYTDIKDAVFAGYGAVFTGAYASSWINKKHAKMAGRKEWI